MDAQVFGIIFGVALGIIVILVILKVQSLLRDRAAPKQQITTHEHLGTFEEQEDGSQVRYCLTCNLKEVVPPPLPIKCNGVDKHDWLKWKNCTIMQDGALWDGQERSCDTCGERQRRHVTATPNGKK